VIRVAVSGALGNMGRLASQTVKATPDLEFAGGFARTSIPEERIYDDIGPLLHEQRPDVLVDFTTRPFTQEAARRALESGVRPVIGSSEWNDAEIATLRADSLQRRVPALLVPNFALGAVLMIRFARQAAEFFPTAEIVEMHHAGKRDKPSGTAAETARRIAAAGGPADVPIHSVRLRGAVSHQAVLFGNTGELLTIRHDSLSGDSFIAGIVAGIRGVMQLEGFAVGLDEVLA
jgi:4-hydroxy-tetrahydrodipicolinate reductase